MLSIIDIIECNLYFTSTIQRGGIAVMADAECSSAGKHYSLLVVGVLVALAGALVLLLSSQFESATTVNAIPVGASLVFVGIITSIYGAHRAFPDAERFEAHAAVTLLMVGCLLLVVGTPLRRLMQVETEVLGVLAIIAGVGLGVAALCTMRRRGKALATFAEKSSVVSAVACAVIIVLLCLTLQGVLLDSIADAFAIKAILLCAAVIVIESVARSLLSRSELETDDGDERDAAIRQRAAGAAHTTLLTLLVPLVVLIAILPESWMAKATTNGIGLQMLVIVMLSELVRHSTSAWLYRRDRT
jgi:hypothetical protein